MNSADDPFRRQYLADIVRTFTNYKALGDRALLQVSDSDLHTMIDPDANSIAVILKHLAGNLRSRFTDFLTTDGEKPDRNRDGEFEIGDGDTRNALMQRWEEGWGLLFGTLESLTAQDLSRTVHIRGEAMTAAAAVARGFGHAAGHVGQIVLLAKHYCGARWKTLSIPRARPAR